MNVPMTIYLLYLLRPATAFAAVHGGGLPSLPSATGRFSPQERDGTYHQATCRPPESLETVFTSVRADVRRGIEQSRGE